MRFLKPKRPKKFSIFYLLQSFFYINKNFHNFLQQFFHVNRKFKFLYQLKFFSFFFPSTLPHKAYLLHNMNVFNDDFCVFSLFYFLLFFVPFSLRILKLYCMYLCKNAIFDQLRGEQIRRNKNKLKFNLQQLYWNELFSIVSHCMKRGKKLDEK